MRGNGGGGGGGGQEGVRKKFSKDTRAGTLGYKRLIHMVER